jgi:hypothetical protein
MKDKKLQRNPERKLKNDGTKYFTERYSGESDFKRIIDYLKGYEVDEDACDLSETREILHAKLYLAALQKAGKIQWPLVLTKRESPDFEIENGIEVIGLEHTRATHQQYQQLRQAIHQDGKHVIYETDIFKPNKIIPRSRLKDQILKEGEGLNGEGHTGWSAEIEFLQFCKIAIDLKLRKLNKEKFKKFAKNVLIIEDDTPIMVSIRPEIVAELLNQFDFWNDERKIQFDEVVIALGPQLIICQNSELVQINVAKKYL